MKTTARGFTLIELMIVVAIIGILAAIAVPAYQDYIARSQMSEAFTMVDGTRVAIEDYALTNGSYPSATTSPSAASLGTTGKYGSAAVTPGTGVIVVTMFAAGAVNASIAGATVTLEPPADLRTGTFEFTCRSSAKSKYLPKHCAGS